MLSLWDPFSWNDANIPYPSQVYTLNLHEFSQQCMMMLDSNDDGESSIITFGDILNRMNVSMDDYYDNNDNNNNNNGQNYQSYGSLLCATADDAFKGATLDVVGKRDDYNPFAYIYFMQQVFPNATNILCDGQHACREATFLLYEQSLIDIYCRGEESCEEAIFENAQSVYCFGSDTCSHTLSFNVVCKSLLLLISSILTMSVIDCKFVKDHHQFLDML